MSLDRYRATRQRPDWLLALAVLSLALFGVLMILSASAYLAGTSGNIYSFVTKQLLSLGLGLVLMGVFSQLDYRHWRVWAGTMLAAVILLLLAVLLSSPIRDVHRWVQLGSVHFQPAEFVKLGFLIYLAAWLARLGVKIRSVPDSLIPFVCLVGLVGGLIMLQPDMGTMVTLVLTAVCVYFLAGAPWYHLGAGVVIGALLGITLILAAPYRFERLQTFLNPTADPLGSGYQTAQITTAIGSGGLWGLGFGQGKLKLLGYVPEVHTDSIFAVVVEELGFVRALLVLVVFLWVILRGFSIARRAPDGFGRYLALGITSLLLVQTFINLAAMLGLVPLTGIPLPFISYGGSSLVVMLAGIGILLSISRAALKPGEQ